MLVAELVARIDSRVPELARRVEGAAELSELVRKGGLPQAPRHAFVLPLGLVARNQGDAAAGAFTQLVDEVFAVMLVIHAAGDIAGARSLATVDQLVWKLIAALAGWGSEEVVGVFSLRRGQLLSAEAGTVIYQLDFAIQNQLRVLP